MNDQNQSNVNGLNSATPGTAPVNGGMFTAPPPVTAPTTSTPTPVTNDVVEDNPFFRMPKPIETTPIEPKPAVTVTPNIPVMPAFNPVVNPIPSDIMEKVTTSSTVSDVKIPAPAAKLDESLPDWMKDLKTSDVPVKDATIASSPSALDGLSFPTSPVAPTTEVSTTAVPTIVPVVAEVKKEDPVVTANPFTSQPSVAPIVNTTAQVSDLPKVDLPAAVTAEKKEVKPVVAAAPVVPAKNDKPVNVEDHKVRDIFLVLAVIILAVLALVLGVALATNAIP